MPATITYSALANQGIQSLLNGGFTNQDIAQLRDNIELWVNNSYAQWTPGEQYFHADESNHLRQQVNIYAELEEDTENEVEILRIEAD